MRTVIAICISLLSIQGHATSEEELVATIDRASSGHILKCADGALLVLYGVAGADPGSSAADAARAFTAETITLEPLKLYKVKEEFGTTYVRVVYEGDKDLSVELVRRGLLSWDKGLWPELEQMREAELRAKEYQSEQASLEKMKSEEEKREAQIARAESQAKRREEEAKRTWAREVARWQGMAREEREVVARDLHERKRIMEEKQERAILLYEMLSEYEYEFEANVGIANEYASSYLALSQIVGRDRRSERALREMEIAKAYGRLTFQEIWAEYIQVVNEILAEDAQLQRETHQLAMLNKELPPEEVTVILDGPSPASTSVSGYTGSGTGFVVAQDKILTCAHVVSDAKQVEVHKDGQVFTGKIECVDEANDWAMLSVEGFKAEPIPMASEAPRLGMRVYNISYPLQGVTRSSSARTSAGDLAGLSGIDDDQRFIQITLPINPGSSGSPIFNEFGQWIGLVTHKLDDMVTLEYAGIIAQGMNFALKHTVLYPLVKSKCSEDLREGSGKKQAGLTLEQTVEEFQDSVVLIMVR